MMTGMRISRYVSFSNINMSSWLTVLTPLGMAGLQYHLTKNFISFSFYDFFLQEHQVQTESWTVIMIFVYYMVIAWQWEEQVIRV